MARLFVSDVHLDAGTPLATEQFLGFLATHAAAAEALYILGDLFEAWVGDDDQDEQKQRVCAALQSLDRRGVACFALHGNRDFLLGAGFTARSGCRLLTDPVVAEFDGERVLLTHGDALCTDDHPYQELRSLCLLYTSVEICPEGFPSQLLHGVAHEHGGAHEHGAHLGAGATHHHGSSGSDHCVFAGLAGAGPAPCATPVLLPLTALAVQPCDIACPALRAQRVRIPQPRAPPALPA